MRNYIIKRLLLIPITLLGILALNFVIVQFAPGGPIEHTLAKYRGFNVDGKSQFSSTAQMNMSNAGAQYQGAQGVPDELIKELEKQFGFDKPAHIRFLKMVKDYLLFDFGKSFYQDKSVIALIGERLPVSVSLGLWSTLIIYLIAIPLGIKKAVRDGSPFDVWTSFAVVIGSAVPVFLFAVFLIVFFAGGTYFQWFPLRGITSDNWEQLGFFAKIADYFWHITLPLIRSAIYTTMVNAFVRSMTSISAVIFLVSVHWNLLTVMIMSEVENSRLGVAAAYCVILMVIVLAAFAILKILVNNIGQQRIRKEKR